MARPFPGKRSFSTTRRTPWAILACCLLGAAGCNAESEPSSASATPAPPTPSSLEIEADYRIREGDAQLGSHDVTKAVESYLRAVRLVPENTHARIQLCRALYKAGSLEEAGQACRRALAYAPDDLDVLHQVLLVLVEAGKPHEAFEPLRQALLKAPNDPRFLGLKASLEKSGTGSSKSRKEIWLTEPFRCRAVSTTRLRTCRFKDNGEGGVGLKFAKLGVSCGEVEFDANGDPAVLKKCRSDSLRIPATARLTADSDRQMWSGSKSGWYWRGDGDKYCCPGMWIAPPKSLRNSN